MAVHWTTVKIDILLVWLWLIRFVLGDCAVVTLPYRNVTLQDAKVRRGIHLDIGSQQQHLAFLMAGYANNTFLWDDTIDNKPASLIEHGGIFHPNQSTTWSNTASSNITANDTRSQMFNFTGTPPQGADDLYLDSGYTLYDFPLATTHDGISMNSLGVGQESTFLQALVEDGAISSKSWSLFYGLAGENAPSQMDGTAVFGGYDKAKIVDETQSYTRKHNFNSNCRTGMVVVVTRIDVGFVNGTEQNAYPSQIQMCLDPAFPIMSFVPDVADNLKEKFGSTSVNTSTGQAAGGLLYDVNDAFTGNLSVTINGHLKITVANSQLVRPDYTSTAKTIEFDDDTREVLVGAPTGDSQPKNIGILGQPFFTAAYLMVNHDQGNFTVWNGNATGEEDFYAIDASGSTCKVGSSSKSLSGGAIAGIVVGVVVGVALIVAALFTFFCYRKRKVAAMQNSHHTISSAQGPTHGEQNWYPTEAPPPFELKPDGVIEAPGDISHPPAAPVEAPGDTSYPSPAPVEAPGDSSHPPPPVCELSSSPSLGSRRT